MLFGCLSNVPVKREYIEKCAQCDETGALSLLLKSSDRNNIRLRRPSRVLKAYNAAAAEYNKRQNWWLRYESSVDFLRNKEPRDLPVFS